MKNLIGAVAPTLSIFKSFKTLMLILFLTIGFASCKNKSNTEVLPQTDLNATINLHDAQTDFDIGGRNDTSTGNYATNDIGGRSTEPTVESKPFTSVNSENNVEHDAKYVFTDIGGRDSGGGLGNVPIFEIGGRGGTCTDTGPIAFCLAGTTENLKHPSKRSVPMSNLVNLNRLL